MDIRHGLLAAGLLLSVNALAAPVAVDDVRTVPVNTPITIDVLNNDSDTNGLTPTLDPAGITQPESGTVSVNADGGITYTPNDNFVGTDSFTYTMFTTDGEVTEFATATVTINVTPSVVTGGGIGFNVTSVAQTIDLVCGAIANTGESDLSNGGVLLSARCDELAALAAADPEAAATALRQIAPEETLALSKLGVNASQFQANVVGARLMQLGQGLSKINTGGLGWSGNLAGGTAGDGSLLAKLGFFASLQLEDADKDTTMMESGFDYSATSLTAGIDYAANEAWFVGGAFGVTSNSLDFKDGGGKVDSTILTFIGYSTYHMGNFNVDVQAGFSNSDIDLSRHISYQTLTNGMFEATTSGTTNGGQWFISTELQYLFSYKALTLYPAIKLNYMDSSVDSYADTGAGGWDVELGEQNVTQSSLEAGVQATYAINTSWGVFIPNIEFQLYDDLDTDQELLTGSFAYAPGEQYKFGMYGEEPESLYYQVGVGFSVLLPKGTSAFAGYRQTLSYTDYSASQFQAGLRMEF